MPQANGGSASRLLTLTKNKEPITKNPLPAYDLSIGGAGRITLAWVGVDIQFGQCLSVLGEELDFSDFDG